MGFEASCVHDPAARRRAIPGASFAYDWVQQYGTAKLEVGQQMPAFSVGEIIEQYDSG